jgi:hypothetical protein
MDSVLYWNGVALEANRRSHTNGAKEQNGPVLSARALAIIHLAMYDALAAIEQSPQYPPYLPNLPPAPSGADIDSAIAGAAYVSLTALFPSLQPYFYERLLHAGLSGPGVGAGSTFGCLVAQILLQRRGNDPGVASPAHMVSLQPGRHRVDPEHPDQGYHGATYGALSSCFAVTARHELDAPPAQGSPEYMKALRQVRAKGIAQNLFGTLPSGAAHRTPTETLIGLFWAYDGVKEIGTPPRLYNQIVRKVAIAKGNKRAQNARLFALVNVAMADAGILAWDQKYIHDLWRPVLGVREHHPSLGYGGSPATDISGDSDPEWKPLGAPLSNSIGKNFTPPFPAYPSGHATFGAAALHMTRLFYNVCQPGPDNLASGLCFVSDELDGITTDNTGTTRSRHVREFPGGLWQMIIENGLSRVFLGVHWIFDAFAAGQHDAPDLQRRVGGVPLGLKTAEDIFDTKMQVSPVGPRFPLVPKLM